MENTFDGTHHLPLQSADARACAQKNQEQIFPLFARIPSLRRTHGYGLSRRALLDGKHIFRTRRHDCRNNTLFLQERTPHRRALCYGGGIYRRIDNTLCVIKSVFGIVLCRINYRLRDNYEKGNFVDCKSMSQYFAHETA